LNNPKLQFWILSRNRPHFLGETLRSAVAQLQPGVEIIVSDNSDNDSIAELVIKEFPDVTLVRRQPVLPALQHFKVILEQACGEYVTLFHDDDVLAPGYFEHMMALMDENPDAAAVACDAQIIRDHTLTSDLVIGESKENRYFSTAEQLLLPYLQFQRLGPAPFPGYMYRLKKIKGLFLNPQFGGKYADVAFLAEVAKRGNVIICNQVLMQYRIHGNNDNVTEHIGSRLRLLRYVLVNTHFDPHSKAILHFKFRYWSRWFKENRNAKIQSRRLLVVRKFLMRSALKLAFTEPGFWLRFFNRARK